jgi:serine protease Do
MENETKDTQISEDKKVAKKKDTSFDALPKPSRTNSSKKNTYPDFSRIPSTDKVKKVLAIFVLVIIIGFGSGWLGAYVQNNNSNGSLSTAKEIVTSQNQVVTAIAKDVDPSVVSIDAQTSTQSQDIFGFTTSTPAESEGTGIIISSSGYIVTNRHVISGATSVSVTLSDGTTINNVKIIGTTASSDSLDIGFLKINNPPEPLQPALLGDFK